MTQRMYITLLDRLRSLPTETEWLEFKRNRYEPQELGEYISALANSAAIASQPCGYLIFGVDDNAHNVVGTSFNPYAAKGRGNQDLIPWLASGLRPNSGFEIHIVEHPDGRVVVFEIGPARGQPVCFYGVAWIRVGTSKTKLANYPEKERALWTLGHDWSAEICEAATVADLDPEAVSKAREQFSIKHPNQAKEVLEWDDTTFLNKAKILKQGAVTNTALLLLGQPETATLLAPSVAKISWVLKDENNREKDYDHFFPPFLLAGDWIQNKIRNLVIRTLPSGTLFPKEIMQYDPWVIREALHNCIAHQDYRLQGRITVVEFPDKIILTNVGSFLPGDVETVIRQDAPQAIYRNPFLADAMVELNLIDTQGGGIKRMFETQWKRSFPLPDYDLSDSTKVSVSISGRILDERYTRLLMEQTDLNLVQVMLLDRVQKRQSISRDEHRRLKADGLVEGRYPNLIVSGKIAKVTGTKGRHIRERGLDKKYYVDLILTLIREHGPVNRQDIDQLIIPKLPDSLSGEQKKKKVHNLIQELRRSGQIQNEGTRANPVWILAEN